MQTLLKKAMKVMERMTAMVVTIQEKSPAVNVLLSALLVMYMAGLILFHAIGNFDYNPIWDKVYYVWDNTKDLLFWIILLFLKPEFALILLLVIIYACIRLILEIITTI